VASKPVLIQHVVRPIGEAFRGMLARAREESPKTSTAGSVAPKSIEALKKFADESGPRIIEGLKKLHRERYPEQYPNSETKVA